MQCSITKTASALTNKRTIFDFASSHRQRKRRRSAELHAVVNHSSNKNNNNNNKLAFNTSCVQHPTTSYSSSFKYYLSIWATLLRQFTALASRSAAATTTTNNHLTQTIFSLILLNTYVCSTYCMATSPCETNHWWAEFKNACLPCSQCQGDMIRIRPCQYDQDTKCGTTADLKIDLARFKDDHDVFNLEDQLLSQQQLQAEEELINIILFVAALACVLLFIVAAFIIFYHMRQWRHIEQSLNHDVEELSNKFMAKLAEVQRIDAGAFFIRNTDSLRIPGYQAQYVLLPEKVPEPRQHQPQQQQWYVVKSLQPGNVYIEET